MATLDTPAIDEVAARMEAYRRRYLGKNLKAFLEQRQAEAGGGPAAGVVEPPAPATPPPVAVTPAAPVGAGSNDQALLEEGPGAVPSLREQPEMYPVGRIASSDAVALQAIAPAPAPAR